MILTFVFVCPENYHRCSPQNYKKQKKTYIFRCEFQNDSLLEYAV